MARTYQLEALIGSRPWDEGWLLMREAVEKGRTFDRGNGLSELWLSWIAAFYDLDMPAAAHHLQVAMEIDPTNVAVLRGAVLVLSALKRFQQAIVLGEYMVSHDPLCSLCYGNLSTAYWVAGHLPQAEAAIRKAMLFSPDGGFDFHYRLGMMLLQKGEMETALDEFQNEPDPRYRLAGIALASHALDRNLDFSILRVSGNPSEKFGTVSFNTRDAQPNESLFIIHHPAGKPLRLTRYRCRAQSPSAIFGDTLRHRCDTLGGSSGSLVFALSDEAVVGLHHSGGLTPVSQTSYNSATRTISIVGKSASTAAIAASKQPLSNVLTRADKKLPPSVDKKPAAAPNSELTPLEEVVGFSLGSSKKELDRELGQSGEWSSISLNWEPLVGKFIMHSDHSGSFRYSHIGNWRSRFLVFDHDGKL